MNSNSEDQTRFDRSTGDGATGDLQDSPGLPETAPSQERARCSFQTPPRSGRRRFESQEHAHVWSSEGRSMILVPVDLKDELEGHAQQDKKNRASDTPEGPRSKMDAEEARARTEGSSQSPSNPQSSEMRPKEDRAAAGKPHAGKTSKSRRAAEVSSVVNPIAFCMQVSALPLKKRLAVYGADDIKKLHKSTNSVDSDVQKRNAHLFARLYPKGRYRRVGSARSIDAVLSLEKSHPHFSEVIQFVADRIAMQKASRLPVRLPPMLMFGPPGVGKTHFCEALATALNVPVRRHPMDQAETSSSLLGSDLSWGNTRYGLVFEMLALGDHANPVVILDELDKVGRSNNSGGNLPSPTSVLHSLLEPVSAARVRDISVDIELDASLITWIATANYPWLIPTTLRSRMKEFLIRMPTAEQSFQVANSVVLAALKDTGIRWHNTPGKRFIAAVAHLSPREIFQATMEAAASAVRRGVRCIEVRDLPMEVKASGDISTVPNSMLH